MAELILTDEEIAAATWVELDDAALGRVVKRAMAQMEQSSDEAEKLRVGAVASLLVHYANNSNMVRLVLTMEGMTHSKRPLGDWRVTIERTATP